LRKLACNGENPNGGDDLVRLGDERGGLLAAQDEASL
jgi:hypothetical protein